MKFYQVNTDVGPQLVVRKDEAKKIDKNYVSVEIPTDSEGLRNHLNALMAIKEAPVREPDPEQNEDVVEDAPEQEQAPTDRDGEPRRKAYYDSQRTFGAIRSLAMMDAPAPGDIPEVIVGEIMTAKGYVLARYAEALAIRYSDLAKRGGK